jgi:peptidoglycan/xylan/chitin deacetylase (PgdA/CDA1 family)
VAAIVRRLLQPLPVSERTHVLDQLRAWASRAQTREPDANDGVSASAPRAGARPLTVEELRRLACAPGIEVAAHTVNHTSLRFQSAEAQRRELAGSRATLERWLGREARGFAYPFGVRGVDFDESTAALVREQGFAYALTNQHGLVTAASDRFALPRCAVPDLDGPGFARWLDALA